jgi:hypothetical protein
MTALWSVWRQERCRVPPPLLPLPLPLPLPPSLPPRRDAMMMIRMMVMMVMMVMTTTTTMEQFVAKSTGVPEEGAWHTWQQHFRGLFRFLSPRQCLAPEQQEREQRKRALSRQLPSLPNWKRGAPGNLRQPLSHLEQAGRGNLTLLGISIPTNTNEIALHPIW